MSSYLIKESKDADAIFVGLSKPPHGPGFNRALVNRYPHIQEWYTGMGTVEFRLIGPANAVIARKKVIKG